MRADAVFFFASAMKFCFYAFFPSLPLSAIKEPFVFILTLSLYA